MFSHNNNLMTYFLLQPGFFLEFSLFWQ